MFLKTAFFSQHDTLSLDPSIASALLDRIADMESTPPACQSHTNTNYISRSVSLSLFETGSTPCSSARSDLWRNRIKAELAQNAEYQYVEIVRTMEDVCRDLERRCNEVEAPLRDERARSTKLHIELDESRLRVAEISSHSHEQSLFLEGIEAEKSELVARVRDLENEQNGLVGRTEDLREELGKAVQQAEDADRIRIKEIRDLELMQAAVLAEKKEFLEIQDRKEQALKAGNERLEADAVELRAKVSVQQDEIGRLAATISDQQIEVRSANTLISKSRDTQNRQEELLDKLGIDRTDLQTEVSRLSDACRDLKVELEDRETMIDSQSATLEKLRCQHEAELSAQSHKLAQLRQSCDQRVEELEQLVNRQTEDAALDAQQRNSRLLQLDIEVGATPLKTK
ncbi:MAG: hypothetical protein Q9172_000262 [Xanthocarpia lactea]